MSLHPSALSRSVVVAAVLVAAGCAVLACKHNDTNAEFAGQGDALDSPVADPVPETTSPPKSTAPPVDAGAPPAPAVPTGLSGVPIALCPLECHVADGSDRILVTEPQRASLEAGLAPTMAGLRQCASQDGMENERHKATINLRFGARGELLDVGVDPTGWSDDVEACMEQVVRGGGPTPNVSLDGPKDVRCSERCERQRGWRNSPR